MIDIHCHILSGLDDGAQDIRESVAMARIAYQDGIRHIIATPHFNASYFNHRELVLNKVRQLQRELDRLRIRITVSPGNEVRLESADFIYEHAKKDHFCYLGPSDKYILLEQRWTEYSKETLTIVRWFLGRGTTPIIPHPERHTFFRSDPQLLVNLIDAGAWTQVSVDSLLGRNSEDAKAFAEWLVNNGHAHTLATDAHNIRRKPNLSAGIAIVRKLAGEQAAKRILERMDGIVAE
jgi:protein-tyrosine phosphatase